MELTFIKASESDWKTVADIEAKINSKLYHPIIKEAEVRDYIKVGNVYLINLDTKTIGTISYEEKSHTHADLDGLVIDPEYQGKGYAAKAVDWMLYLLKDYKIITLVTHPLNTVAIKLYLNHGFSIDCWKENFFGDGEPRIEMKKINSLSSNS